MVGTPKRHRVLQLFRDAGPGVSIVRETICRMCHLDTPDFDAIVEKLVSEGFLEKSRWFDSWKATRGFDYSGGVTQAHLRIAERKIRQEERRKKSHDAHVRRMNALDEAVRDREQRRLQKIRDHEQLTETRRKARIAAKIRAERAAAREKIRAERAAAREKIRAERKQARLLEKRVAETAPPSAPVVFTPPPPPPAAEVLGEDPWTVIRRRYSERPKMPLGESSIRPLTAEELKTGRRIK